MLPIERYYRHLLLIERLQQLHGELLATADHLDADSVERSALDVAEKALPLMIFAMQGAANEALRQCQDVILREQMEASLELLGRSPERMRAEVDGEE